MIGSSSAIKTKQISSQMMMVVVSVFDNYVMVMIAVIDNHMMMVITVASCFIR